MFGTLLQYPCGTGKPPLRRIERATYNDVTHGVFAGDQHPHHDSIAAFPQRHLRASMGLFVQVFQLFEAVGFVQLRHTTLDGTKIKADQSKHKAMNHHCMRVKGQELDAELAGLLQKAARVDAAQDAEYGKGRRGDD